MNRRALLFAGLVLPALPAVASAASGVEVIYVGGWDCPYCTMWKNRYKEEWLASPEYRQVTYVEVDSPKLREAYQERFWPGDLREVLAQIPRKSGTPRFLIVKDGRIVFNDLGVDRWKRAMLALKNVLG
ncbi:MAG TPA: hypothetical protein VMI56_18405 [Reyranella sp.]|nr:hypothetical protein [Reyranella sp.]